MEKNEQVWTSYLHFLGKAHVAASLLLVRICGLFCRPHNFSTEFKKKKSAESVLVFNTLL